MLNIIMEQSNTGSIKYSQEESYMGCVKWFNNQKGFGYVTVKSGPLVNEDIFTHHSAIILQNASTQFADGGEFGFGAEIGISTDKLHVRGPVGAEHLTSFKYVIYGNGQVRP